jgi:hypothetical protein
MRIKDSTCWHKIGGIGRRPGKWDWQKTGGENSGRQNNRWLDKIGFEAEHREEETNWCFHGFVGLIMLLRDLAPKVAEDFAAMGARIGVPFQGV